MRSKKTIIWVSIGLVLCVLTWSYYIRVTEKASLERRKFIGFQYKGRDFLSFVYKNIQNLELSNCESWLISEGFVFETNTLGQVQYISAESQYSLYQCVVSMTNLTSAVSNNINHLCIAIEQNGRIVERYGFIVTDEKRFISKLPPSDQGKE